MNCLSLPSKTEINLRVAQLTRNRLNWRTAQLFY